MAYTANGEPIETRPRETLRGQVDSRSAPDHFPTGQTATTEADIYENRTNPLASDSAPAAEAPLLPAGAVPGDFAAAQPA